VGAWLLGLVALVASPALATATLPAPNTPLPALLASATVDALEAELVGDVASAPPQQSTLTESGFSLGPVPLGTYGRLFDGEQRVVEPLPRFDVEEGFDVELPRLPKTRVEGFALFTTPSPLPSNRVSSGSATGLGLCLVATCDPPIQSFLSEDPFAGLADTPPSLHRYLYAHGNPAFFIDPTGMCVLGLPCPEIVRSTVSAVKQAVRDQIDTNVAFAEAAVKTTGQLANGLAHGAVKTADFVTLGAVSSAGTRMGTFLGTSGTLEERRRAAVEEGNRAQLATVTLGFSEAEDKGEHARQLVRQTFGAEKFEHGSQVLAEGIVNNDPDKVIRGSAEILGGASQVTLVVAGTAEGAQRLAGVGRASEGAAVVAEDSAAPGARAVRAPNTRHVAQVSDVEELDALVQKLGDRALQETKRAGVRGQEAGGFAESRFNQYLEALNQRLARNSSPYTVELQPAVLPGTGRVPAFVEYSGGRVFPYPESLRLDAALSDTRMTVTTPSVSADVYPTIVRGYDITVDLSKQSAVTKYTDAFGVPIGDIRPRFHF
jgi:RHS repeat-associated protein